MIQRTVSTAEWIREHGTALTELELAAPLADLAPLAGIAGGARVVALGESSHHVQEFYQVRHRMLRYLVERCGHTVVALEAPFTEGRALAQWVDGGPGRVADAVDHSIPLTLGDVPELHEVLAWLRTHNRTPGTTPVHYAGTDLPGSIGSPLPALERITEYLRTHDRRALPALERATALVRRFHHTDSLAALAAYPALAEVERDALTAALAELTARMQRSVGHDDAEHALVSHHLRGAWLLDQFHRSLLADGMASASTFRDLYQAESVLRLLAADPGARVVLAAHNWHIQRTPVHEDGEALLPAGYHLAAALGDDYRAIGVTCRGGHTAVADGDRFLFREAPLPPAPEDTVEAAFPGDTVWALADVRAASEAVTDTDEYRRARMADYFCDQPAFHAFDAVACVSQTRGTEYTRP